MNKWILRLASLLVVVGLLTACGTDNESQEDAPEQSENNQAEEQSEEVVITISENEGEEVITEKEITIEENAILMEVMKENFEIEEEGGFINSIEGVKPEEDEQRAWMYFVNDEAALVGAQEYELTPGDKVTFDLQAWD
ncbi:DUF4430 domain-containing protein [Virgibacillus sp. C22-A2]|uniref:DUF4430 domain-containing protein n=1 Tax=Virgibacillus tibetensis TaxID=3042313 RepID=A0ABU6KAR9_9BACI|nr:DUF4430 domain-containing protein [Virgibacillus sp. C22-A2]